MEKLMGTSLLIFCLLLGWVSCLQKVEQTPQFLTIQERESITINCSFTENSQGLQWFRQDAGKGLISLFYLASGMKEEGRLKSRFNLEERHSSLHIIASQSGDSATYHCGASGSGGSEKLIFGSGTSLTVLPNIQNPEPALYQLTSPKLSDTSVCLLTDTGSYNTTFKNEYTNGSDPTVLEMMTMESKSYGAVAWGSKSTFNCTDAFPQNFVNLTQPSGSTCNVKDVKQSFETDKDLNLMNLSLIGFRIIFLKTVAFNLLMTFRLWSN